MDCPKCGKPMRLKCSSVEGFYQILDILICEKCGVELEEWHPVKPYYGDDTPRVFQDGVEIIDEPPEFETVKVICDGKNWYKGE